MELPRGFREAALDRSGSHCEVVLDRSEAIEHALRAASVGDVVMILGRGNLVGELLDCDGRRRPFDDRQEARRALVKIGRAGAMPGRTLRSRA